MSGPLYPRRTMLEQIKGNLHKISLLGMSAIYEIEEDETKFSRLMLLSAPLDACLSKVVNIEIIAQHNPSLTTRLPCPVYNVTTATPLFPRNIAVRNAGTGPSPYPKVANMDIEGSYTTLTEATAKAEELTKIFEQNLLRPQRVCFPASAVGGTFARGIFGEDRNGEIRALCVEVKYDSGEIMRG